MKIYGTKKQLILFYLSAAFALSMAVMATVSAYKLNDKIEDLGKAVDKVQRTLNTADSTIPYGFYDNGLFGSVKAK